MIQTGENRRIGRETFVTATFPNIKPIGTVLTSNPDILGEMTATDFFCEAAKVINLQGSGNPACTLLLGCFYLFYRL